MEQLLIRPRDLTKILSLSRSRIYELLATGELPSVRIGRSIRVPVGALNEWIEQQQRGHRADGRE
ncbi:MAG: helix-turn-helix domain-containing protein [Planctomycetes bacterium]|nr:helix-turn-helix domain-containing protein [Planctomycetota bacterium]